MKTKKFSLTLYQTVFLIILLFLTIIQPFRSLSDPDMFWHIETGNYILNTHSIPHIDIFSHYGIENNLPWIAHEWLSDIILALLYRVGGYTLLRFFPSIMLLTIFLYIYKKTKNICEDSFEKYIWYFLSFLMISSLSEVRAHMFSWLFCAITINVLFDFYKNQNKKSIFILPIISCLWVNMHGGSSSLIFVLLAIFIIIPLFNFNFLKLQNTKLNKNYTIKLLIVFCLCILTALINPNTYKILLYPIENMQDKLMLSVIVEWHSPDFHTFDGLMIFILLATITSILTITKKDVRLLDFVLVAAFCFLTLKSIRQVVYLSIIATPIILNYIPKCLNLDNSKRFGYTIISIILCLSCILYLGVHIQDPDIEENIYPSEDAINAIVELHPQKMLNNYDWGGYIIKTLNDKNIHPFIDGRADVYSKYTLGDFTKIMYLYNGWEDLIKKYDFDAIIMNKDSLFTREAQKLPGWHSYYDDGYTVILNKE